MTTSSPDPARRRVLLSTPEFCKLVGITYRMADYWSRVGVLVPVIEPTGSGTPRCFDEPEVQVATVLSHLRLLGADMNILRRVASQLRIDKSFLAPGALYIDPEGWCSHTPLVVCWRLDVMAIASVVPAGA